MGAVFLALLDPKRPKNAAPAGHQKNLSLGPEIDGSRIFGPWPKNAAPAGHQKKPLTGARKLTGAVFLALLGPERPKNAAPASPIKPYCDLLWRRGSEIVVK